MKLTIRIFDSGDMQIGKMSKKTYDNLPEGKKPKLYEGDVFFIGDLEKPSITIEVKVEDIEENALFIHQKAKDLYYGRKKNIVI